MTSLPSLAGAPAPSRGPLLEALFTQGFYGVAEFDLALRFVRLNETLAHINGLPVDAHLGRTVAEVVPALVASVEEVTAQVASSRAPVTKEIRGETPAQPGVLRTWLEHWLPLFNADQALVGYAVLVEETTDREAVLRSLQLTSDALRASEARLRLSLEAAYLISFSWDIVRDEVHRFHSVSSVLPATARPVRFADVLAAVHPDDRVAFQERVDRCLAGPEQYENEFRVLEADGTVRWLYERGVVTRADDGTPLTLSGLSQDITARKTAELALQVANRRKDEFLATLAHELRNPLAPIRSAAEVLRMLAPEDPTMQKEVSQMVRLVDDLLDVNRISRGDILLLSERVDVADAVRAAVETSRPLIEAGEHHLQVSLPLAPVTVTGDAARLSQALSNLLNNAAHYTPMGGQIALTVVRDGGRVRIAVTDNGRGLPADRCDDVFEMFTRVQQDGQGGLGIGLALVRRIVELHGGEVRALSNGEGQGCTFEMWLPALGLAPSPDVARTAAANVVPAAVGAKAQGLRILIVDDNVDFAQSEATMLELKQHIVCVVHDARAALDVVPVFAPDVALLDIGLPGMDGYELAARLRADPANADLVLIAQTGWGQPADRERALAQGFRAHLTKPVDWATLERVLLPA
jgi:signal transduction histidine kinase